MDCSTPSLPIHPQLPELNQTHAHWVGDAIQPAHPLSFPSPPALKLSQHHFGTINLLRHVQLFATPWTLTHQASPSIINSEFIQLRCTQLEMPSNHLILCYPSSSCLQLFPASGSFPMSQFFTSGGQSIAVSVSASVLPVNIQDWFPSGWTGLISFQSKRLSRVFFKTTV